ncbi:MAG: CDP-alcohol phosphatidyltransferase family protein [Anaerolineales bacterium]|nr:CDP-alcohol phosphatidyltransferase family protein [Anaerolineales bacterium]
MSSPRSLTPASNLRSPLRLLRIRWGLFAVFVLVCLGAGYRLAQSIWYQPVVPFRWALFSALAYAYLLIGLWRNLPQNHRPDETEILPTFGWGNTLSLVRGVLMMALVGFLFQPRPGAGSLNDWRAWVPGLLYTLAALPDYVDGYFARITNHVTRLGEWLDMTLDSVGVLAASFLAVQYGTIPWWYLPIGLARYLFLAGIWFRTRRGLPVYEMPYSVRRRGFAALKMGFIFVILLPPFLPPGTHLAAAVFGIPFAVGFLWDWGYVSGMISADAGNRFPNLKHFVLRWLPLVPRGVALTLIVPALTRHLQIPHLQWLASLELAATILLALGIWPRTVAIGAVILVGVNQVLAPLTIDQLMLIVAYISIIFLGTGAYSLWPFEERLIYHRPGDRETAVNGAR